MNKLREIESFIAVVENGSFVKAADATGASKTAVSRYIADLETRLGTRLLQRTTRKLSLTPAGQHYFERCRRLLGELDEADAAASAGAAQPVGLLRVNAPHSFGVLHLAPLWPAFMQQYPRIELDITLSDRLADIIDEGYDVAIRIARLPDSSLVYRKLAATRMVACASPAYLQAHGKPKHPSDLIHHAAIAYSYFSGKDEWRFNGPSGPVSVRTHARLHANNGDTCVAAAVAGAGIMLQPAFLVARQLADGTLVEILPEFNAPEIGIYAVYPTRKQLAVKVRALIDFLAEAFQHADWAEPPTGRKRRR